jgi:hypothetical protein
MRGVEQVLADDGAAEVHVRRPVQAVPHCIPLLFVRAARPLLASSLYAPAMPWRILILAAAPPLQPAALPPSPHEALRLAPARLRGTACALARESLRAGAGEPARLRGRACALARESLRACAGEPARLRGRAYPGPWHPPRAGRRSGGLTGSRRGRHALRPENQLPFAWRPAAPATPP